MAPFQSTLLQSLLCAPYYFLERLIFEWEVLQKLSHAHSAIRDASSDVAESVETYQKTAERQRSEPKQLEAFDLRVRKRDRFLCTFPNHANANEPLKPDQNRFILLQYLCSSPSLLYFTHSSKSALMRMFFRMLFESPI